MTTPIEAWADMGADYVLKIVAACYLVVDAVEREAPDDEVAQELSDLTYLILGAAVLDQNRPEGELG